VATKPLDRPHRRAGRTSEVTTTRVGRRVRWTALLAVVIATSALLVAPSAFAADPPPNPTDQQLTAAAQAKDALSTQVGQLSAQVASLQAQLDQLKADEELAEQKLALALQQLDDAKTAATTAAANVKTAQATVVSARSKYEDFVRTTYMSSPVTGTAGALLTASDPQSLLQHSDYLNYTANHQLDAISQLDKATVDKSNADAAARSTVLAQQKATATAQQAQSDAVSAVQAADSQQQQVAASLAAQQTALQTAQADLATLNGQRAAYDAYQAEQARLAAIAAAQAAAAAAAAAAARAAHPSGSSPSVPTTVTVGATSGGSWTAAAGQTAANRALSYLNWPYAWDGGNASGPTKGVCAGDGAFNDCHIVGFDCSGLAMYGWGPYLSMPHYAASQYSVAGHVHPGSNSFLPGDLLFWSSNGAQSGIHHVAIYIGNGNVVQAPESGDVIKITAWNRVSSGYFGATRPLT
jgi:cell wall-associated NlpC family hydrolase